MTRGRRGLLPLAMAVAATGVTGCATKGDIRDVRGDIARVEARQDSINNLLQRQNREILDSLAVATERLLNVRGELGNQLSQLQDELVQVAELTSQVQIRLNQFDQELAAAIRELTRGGAGVDGGAAIGPSGDGAADDPEASGIARDVYEMGMEQVNLDNAATARRAFQMVVDSFPDQPMAPDAQRQLAETYVMDGEYDAAMLAFERVVERYPDSDAAPRALYRAGIIAQERGQNDRAREYFRRVVAGYPDSDARRLAEDALDRIR